MLSEVENRRPGMQGIRGRRLRPAPLLREQMLFLAVLGQILFAACLIAIMDGIFWLTLSWWGLALLAAGLVLLVISVTGLGKIELPSMMAALAMDAYFYHGEYRIDLIYVMLGAVMVSIGLYLKSGSGGISEFSRIGKAFHILLAPVSLLQIATILPGLLFAIWFLVHWGMGFG